jgi:hypothetical protein
MSRVSISRSYAVLVGLEAYVKTRKKVKKGVAKVEEKKEEVLHPGEVEKRREMEKDKSESAEKERRILEEKQRMEEEERRKRSWSNRMMKKLGLGSGGKADRRKKHSSHSVMSNKKDGQDVEDADPAPSGGKR